VATSIDRPSADRHNGDEAVQRRAAPRRPLVRLEPVEARHQSRISEIVVGVVVVAVFGLAAVLWQASSSNTESVLVLGRSVKAGEELTPDALRAEDVRVGAGVAHLPAEQGRAVVGRVATGDLPAGTLVSEDLFVPKFVAPAGTRVVEAPLSPGQFATLALRPGQRVTVIRTADATNGTAPAGQVITDKARVYEVAEGQDADGSRIVGLLVPTPAAPAVAGAAATKKLWLALVPDAES
jgi:hypothetical protein